MAAVIRTSISLAALCLAGCASQPPLVGHWVGQEKIAVPAGQSAEMAGYLGKIDLRVDKFGNAELVYRGMVTKGRLETDGQGMKVVCLTMLGNRLNQPIERRLKVEGESVSFVGEEGIVSLSRAR